MKYLKSQKLNNEKCKPKLYIISRTEIDQWAHKIPGSPIASNSIIEMKNPPK